MAEPARLAPVEVEGETAVVEAAPVLRVVPLEWRRQEHSGVSDGWVLVAPLIGITVGTAINVGGVFGVAGCVAGGVVGVLTVREVGGRLRVWERNRSARNRRVGYRKALPVGDGG